MSTTMKSNRNNTAVHVPVRFPLSSQTPGEALTVIGYVTNGFNDLPEEVYHTVVNNITYHRGPITYGYLKGPETVEAIKIIIGYQGCFMKKTTDQTGAYFLWHDRQKNIFMFWGEHMSVIKAMHAIRYRIVHAIRYRIEKYGTLAPATLAPATLAPMSSDEVDAELAYYERKEALEAEREPEQPDFDLPLVSPVLPFAKRTANDANSDDDVSYELSDLSDLYLRRSLSRGKKCEQTLAANHLRASSAPSSSSDTSAAAPCIGRTSSAPVQMQMQVVPESESPLPVLEPCPFAPVDDFIGFDDEDIPTIESIEKRFQDGLIYLEKNPDLVKFVENRVLPSIEDIAISHLPNFIRMKNDLGFKNEAPCDFAMYLATLHTRLLKAKFEVAERENRKPIIMDYFEAKPHLEKFVREFDHPMGFVWSTDPCIDELYHNLGQETDSPSSFALYLRELQAFLKKEYEKKNVHVNRCIICQVDMGECNPRQYCGKTRCVRGW